MDGVLILAAATVLVFLAWRAGSRRRNLPCPVWLRWMVELDNPFARTNRAAFIIEHLGLEEGMSVLDAGCGPGRLTIPAAQAVGPAGRVLATDIQGGMLARVREKAFTQGMTNIEFLQAGLGDGNLPEKAFDRALLVTVLGEIPDRAASLREIFGALRPGGILSVTEIVFDPHFQTRGTVTALAREAGFLEAEFFGNSIAYTAHFTKPCQPAAERRDTRTGC
ncbi:class I SAM-dependent methyltransferase [Desulfomicrobium salsuginis]